MIAPGGARMLGSLGFSALALLGHLLPGPAGAGVSLPPGFAATVYATGAGFESGASPGVTGLPATSTMAFDDTGALYLARAGRRYMSGEGDDLYPVLRLAPGGGRLSAAHEARHHYGPPLRNPQVAAARNGQELFVTAFDRDRRIGVIYRLRDGRAELFAGGTPPHGAVPLLRQPEGVAFDSQGRLYVADRDQGRIVRLDGDGRLLDGTFATMMRPRLVAVDDRDHLWVGADAEAQAPWQQGPGEIWRVSPQGHAALVLRGPVAAGLEAVPGGQVLVADRHAAKVFALTADGRRRDLATMSEGDAPRGLTFAPDTPATRRLGIAGHLFVVTIPRGAWMLNEIVEIKGPFPQWLSAGEP